MLQLCETFSLRRNIPCNHLMLQVCYTAKFGLKIEIAIIFQRGMLIFICGTMDEHIEASIRFIV